MSSEDDIGASETLPPYAKVVRKRTDGTTVDRNDGDSLNADDARSSDAGSHRSGDEDLMAADGGHPLGPWIEPIVPAAPKRGRLVAGLVAGVGLALVGVAFWLTPDPSGFGTHRQLGMPHCTSLVLTGYPCPTCGMTTAFSLTVRGRLFSAFSAQPAGLLFAVGTMLVTVVALVSALSGRFWTPNFYRISWPRWAVGFVVLLLAGWVYKLAVGLAAGTLPIGR